MEKYDFPLFVEERALLACISSRVKFGLDDLVKFCGQVQFSGSFALEQERFKSISGNLESGIIEELTPNFVSKEGVVYLRGRNYFLGGKRLDSPRKIEMMFKNIRNLNSTLDRINGMETGQIEEAALVCSALDHMKHYMMIAFNAIYKKCLESGKDRALDLSLGLCDSSIASYFKGILQGKIETCPISEDEIEALEAEVEPKYLRAETDFYREMDNPQRILLHAGNMISHAKKRYCIVVNPLSGATEPGFAIRAISQECGEDIVRGVFPLRYSVYQNANKEVEDFDSLLRTAVANCFVVLLPPEEDSPILILDDNIASGDTLLQLREMFRERYNDVDISAIEARKRYFPGLDLKDRRTDPDVLRELAFEPIGETRRNAAVNIFINEYLLGGR